MGSRRRVTVVASASAALLLVVLAAKLVSPSGVRHLSDRSFAQLRDRSDQLLLIDCYADWCQPCRHLAPELDKVAKRFAGRVVVGKLNVDACPDTARQYGVRVLPTLLLFRAGKLIGTGTGYVEAGKLAEWVATHLD